MIARKVTAGALFMLATGFGAYVAVNSWGGVIYLGDSKVGGNGRNPAAIRKVFDFSHLDGTALKVASQKRLITDARVVSDREGVGIELGHFVTKGEDGSKQFACDYYNKLVLTFEADGIAESGDKPVMRIEAPCAISTDINRMAAVMIPVARITGNKPSGGIVELDFPDLAEVHFEFRNVGSEWPRLWSLQAVRLYNEAEAAREVTVTQRELTDILDRPIVIAW